jgi:hypothetical protein
MAGKYASATAVSSEQSKVEIERTLRRYGADGFLSGWQGNEAFVSFVIANRQVKFRMALPNPADDEFCVYERGYTKHRREPTVAHKLWQQACRQKWRALALVIKAKLEAVDAGISVIEDEFLANIVMPDGRLVGETIRPRIALAYDGGDVANLLPDYSKGAAS